LPRAVFFDAEMGGAEGLGVCHFLGWVLCFIARVAMSLGCAGSLFSCASGSVDGRRVRKAMMRLSAFGFLGAKSHLVLFVGVLVEFLDLPW
jgi:hypothetical protein